MHKCLEASLGLSRGFAMPRALNARTTAAVLLLLVTFSVAWLTRPVSAATPDFNLSATPGKVSIPMGFWAETMLTFTSLNGFEGRIELSTSLTNSGLIGAGFSTGMMLSPDGEVSTDLRLTPGSTAGDYILTVNATSGSVSHLLLLPVTISDVSGPDFISQLWGSWSILQERNNTIQEPLYSLGGFQGQVSLAATVTPTVPDAPSISFQPAFIVLSESKPALYNTTISTVRTTPVANYIVAVSATSGTMSHIYRAIVMVGDYRPPSETPPTGNATTTTQPSPGATTNSHSSPTSTSSALSTLQSFWWLQTLMGLGVATIVMCRRKRLM